MSKHCGTKEQRTENDSHPRHGGGRVLRFILFEGRHTVGNGLHSGQSYRPRREALQQQEQCEVAAYLPLQMILAERLRGRVIDMAQAAVYSLPCGHAKQQHNHGNVEIGGRSKQATGLTQTTQVGQRDQGNEPETDQYPLVGQILVDGDDGLHPRRDGHRHGEDVVDQQRRRRQNGWVLAQILTTHDVRSAAGRIGEDGLSVADHHDHQQHGHHGGDGHQLAQPQRQAGTAHCGHRQDFARGIRGGRDGV